MADPAQQPPQAGRAHPAVVVGGDHARRRTDTPPGGGRREHVRLGERVASLLGSGRAGEVGVEVDVAGTRDVRRVVVAARVGHTERPADVEHHHVGEASAQLGGTDQRAHQVDALDDAAGERARLGAGAVEGVPQLGVAAARCDQLLVAAVLDDAALLDDDDARRAAGGLQAVRDEQRGAAARRQVHRPLDLGLGGEIEVRRRLVEDEDRRIHQLGTRPGRAAGAARRRASGQSRSPRCGTHGATVAPARGRRPPAPLARCRDRWHPGVRRRCSNGSCRRTGTAPGARSRGGGGSRGGRRRAGRGRPRARSRPSGRRTWRRA